jgi:hypothetical protein
LVRLHRISFTGSSPPHPRRCSLIRTCVVVPGVLLRRRRLGRPPYSLDLTPLRAPIVVPSWSALSRFVSLDPHHFVLHLIGRGSSIAPVP